MERVNTKELILEVALDLFSVNGYEATSISQIADAVGVRKASLYSHFASKQDILDTVVGEVLKHYRSNSVFEKINWNSDAPFAGDSYEKDIDKLIEAIKGQLDFVVHNPLVKKARKLLVIEQFGNPYFAELLTERNYTGVMNGHVEMMKFLMEKGVIREGDTEIIAAQFCLPISVWLSLIDRHPEMEAEVFEKIDRHIREFFAVYKK